MNPLWKRRYQIAQRYIRWYSLNDIVKFIHRFQEYILDPDCDPTIMPELPQPVNNFNVRKSFSHGKLFVPESSTYTLLMFQLRTTWNTTRNRYTRTLEEDAPYKRTDEEEEAFSNCITNILLWIDSADNIFDRRRFEAYYGGAWRLDANWSEDENSNTDLDDHDGSYGSNNHSGNDNDDHDENNSDGYSGIDNGELGGIDNGELGENCPGYDVEHVSDRPNVSVGFTTGFHKNNIQPLIGGHH